MGQLTGHIAVITGAAGGIGAAMARRFVVEGAQVVIADVDGEGAQALADELGPAAHATQTDVRDAEALRAMFAATVATFGPPSLLVNNAGWSADPAPLHEIDPAAWGRTLDVCLTGVFLGCQLALPLMIERGGGCIINIASIAGLVAAPGIGAYAAAKAGVIALTKTLAAEYAQYNIRCNALAPGWTQTTMLDQFLNGDAKREAGILKATPQRRFGKPEEVAAAAVFLAAGEADFLHGQTIALDGGLTIL